MTKRLFVFEYDACIRLDSQETSDIFGDFCRRRLLHHLFFKLSKNKLTKIIVSSTKIISSTIINQMKNEGILNYFNSNNIIGKEKMKPKNNLPTIHQEKSWNTIVVVSSNDNTIDEAKLCGYRVIEINNIVDGNFRRTIAIGINIGDLNKFFPQEYNYCSPPKSPPKSLHDVNPRFYCQIKNIIRNEINKYVAENPSPKKKLDIENLAINKVIEIANLATNKVINHQPKSYAYNPLRNQHQEPKSAFTYFAQQFALSYYYRRPKSQRWFALEPLANLLNLPCGIDNDIEILYAYIDALLVGREYNNFMHVAEYLLNAYQSKAEQQPKSLTFSMKIHGHFNFKIGKFESAIKLYQKVLKKFQDSNVLTAVGRCYAGLEEFEQSKLYFENSIAQHNSEYAHYYYGISLFHAYNHQQNEDEYNQQEKLKQVLKQFQQAFNISRGDFRPYFYAMKTTFWLIKYTQFQNFEQLDRYALAALDECDDDQSLEFVNQEINYISDYMYVVYLYNIFIIIYNIFILQKNN